MVLMVEGLCLKESHINPNKVNKTFAEADRMKP